MRTWILTVVLSLSALGAADKQTPPAPDKPKPFVVPVHETYSLPNGMKVTLVPWGTLPVAAVGVNLDPLTAPGKSVFFNDRQGTLLVRATQQDLDMIEAAIQARKEITGEWRLILSGLLSMTLGVILFAAPLTGALAMAIWIGAYAVVDGALLIGLGFQLRSWGRHHTPKLQSHAV